MPALLTKPAVDALKSLQFREVSKDTAGSGSTFYGVSDGQKNPLRFYIRITEADAGVVGSRIGYLMKGDRNSHIPAHIKAYTAACKAKGGFKGLKQPKDSNMPAWSEPFPVVASIHTSGKGVINLLDKAVDAAFFKTYGHTLENLERRTPSKAEYAHHIDMKIPSMTYHTLLTNNEDLDIGKLLTGKLEGATISFVLTGVNVKAVFDGETETMVHTYSPSFKIDNIYNLPGAGKGPEEEKENAPVDPASYDDMKEYVDSLYSKTKKTPKSTPRKRARAIQDDESSEDADGVAKDLEKDLSLEEGEVQPDVQATQEFPDEV